MSQNAVHCRVLFLLLVCLPGMGCSVATGNMLTFFPERKSLSKDAKLAREVTASQGTLPLPRELNKAVLPAYVVQPGDGLLVQPASLDSEVVFMADQTVLADGTIHLGKYGQIIVAGQTIPNIESMVRTTVNQYHKKDMGAMVARIVVPDSLVYYVLGEVNSPGSFPLKGSETALDGILAAGGLNARASEKSIIISRPTPPHGCRVVLPVCYQDIVQVGDTTTNYQLKPGDRIYVATRTILEGLCGHCRKGVCTNPQTPCMDGQCTINGIELPADAPTAQPLPQPTREMDLPNQTSVR